jgi:hypothetical protein
VTYAKLADFTDQHNGQTLAAYRKGSFARVAVRTSNVVQLLR